MYVCLYICICIYKCVANKKFFKRKYGRPMAHHPDCKRYFTEAAFTAHVRKTRPVWHHCPSGVPGRAWAASGAVFAGHIRQVFNDCLNGGVFPQPWRRAKLVLLRKDGKPADSPSGYRPICLLDKEAKLFERIIAGRLVRHLEETGPDLASIPIPEES